MSRLLTPLKKVRGLGSAKEGVHHWWMQRVSAVALVPLTLWAAFSVASMAGKPYEAVLTYFAAPFNVAMFTLFLFAGFYHASLGLQVFIEDYIHHENTKIVTLIAMKLLMVLLGTVSILAVLRVTFGG
ncbi:succinate dehydrogenase, hydrophobic membrane anchor protein [Thiofilum flexile]|uniref:succinate dehydrogenase, hydrophobic membrane anchor protein n=1 Tax=Thiofilum flexile TaxID=125627 RepID=UPI00035F2CB0|nr:succinate dehydrogenase, hydrophobic membrane anchor protein [Thiofilum flexile]